jgi:tetratricopeptide (TPR) repeat protein
MSEDLRRQVRARLDAEASKLAGDRSAPRPVAVAVAKPSRARRDGTGRIQAPKIDLEREARVRRDLTELQERVARQNLYEVLGVHRRAAESELRASWDALAQERHPDKLVGGTTSRELRALAEAIYLATLRAHETLSDADARRAYDRTLSEAPLEDRVAPKLLAARVFERGLVALAKSEVATAVDAFREAVALDASEGTYWAHAGFAAHALAPSDPEVRTRALSELDRAILLDPRCEDAFVFRGTIHQRAGNRADAVRDFEGALKLNADSLPALRALRQLEPPAPKKTGLLSRLTLGSG